MNSLYSITVDNLYIKEVIKKFDELKIPISNRDKFKKNGIAFCVLSENQYSLINDMFIIKEIKLLEKGNNNKYTLQISNKPWIDEEAITYLESILKPEYFVLEFGCGGSTIWFSKLVKFVYSVEHNPNYYFALENKKIENVMMNFVERPYASFCDKFADCTFDMVFVDGRDRVECIRKALSKVRHLGYFVVDDSEREKYKIGLDLLLENGYKQLSVFGKQKQISIYQRKDILLNLVEKKNNIYE